MRVGTGHTPIPPAEIVDLLLQFSYGQVFFLLGIIMLLQWRQKSRLELATGLPLLAVFGFFEALHEWGDIFLPFLNSVDNPDFIRVFELGHVGLLVANSGALLSYALHLVKPHWPRWGVLSGAFLLSLAASLLPSLLAGVYSEAAIRYLIYLPSAILIALGLRLRARGLVGPLGHEGTINNLRFAGIGFLFFGLFEGFFTPRAAFFPANILNEQSFLEVTGFPISLARALSGGVILFFFFRALEVFHVETSRIQKQLEQEQSLNEERQRISRDLHDGTLQTIYASGLVLEDARFSIQNACDTPATDEAANARRKEQIVSAGAQLDHVSAMLGKIVEDIRKAIYDLRSAPSDGDFSRGLIEIVGEFRIRSGLPTEWRTIGAPARPLSADEIKHVHQILREALSNVQRHARASCAQVEMRYAAAPEKAFQLRIQDDGEGDIPAAGQVGRGLQNMRERAALLKGQLSVAGLPGRGAVVLLEFD